MQYKQTNTFIAPKASSEGACILSKMVYDLLLLLILLHLLLLLLLLLLLHRGAKSGCKLVTLFDSYSNDGLNAAIGVRAQWDLSRKVNLKLEELAHMFFYVKLNFKLGLFSSTFWFEHSLRSENAYL